MLVPPDAAPTPTAGRAPRTKPRGFLMLAVAYFLFGFGYIITATFLVDMVRGRRAIRHLEPYIWVMVGVGAAPSVALWGGSAGAGASCRPLPWRAGRGGRRGRGGCG